MELTAERLDTILNAIFEERSQKLQDPTRHSCTDSQPCDVCKVNEVMLKSDIFAAMISSVIVSQVFGPDLAALMGLVQMGMKIQKALMEADQLETRYGTASA